jgi:hypothetical protein
MSTFLPPFDKPAARDAKDGELGGVDRHADAIQQGPTRLSQRASGALNATLLATFATLVMVQPQKMKDDNQKKRRVILYVVRHDIWLRNVEMRAWPDVVIGVSSLLTDVGLHRPQRPVP